MHEGEFIGVVGPNGGGKTTLLKLILGLIRPDKGYIKVFGDTPVNSRPLVEYVPQHSTFDLDFPISVIDVVLMSTLSKTPLFGRYSKPDQEIAIKALEMVGIADLHKRHISELSAGQRQRVLLARALAGEAKLLILDEPTASVDSSNEEDIYKLLKEINKTSTIILVTHDLGFISIYVNRVACVNRLMQCHHTRDITGEIINDVYQRNVEMIRHKCGL